MKAEQLRKSILQMAIQGKLVPQDSSDEPASVLLEKIRAEKESLIKQGKIKKDKNDSVIFKGEDGKFYEKIGKEIKVITEEIDFDFPNDWGASRLCLVCWLGDGKKMNGESLPYLDAKTLRGKSEKVYINSGKIVDVGFKVILVDGENSGEAFDVPYKAYMGSTFKVLEINRFLNPKYINIILNYYRQTFKGNKTGAAIPHLNKQLFKTIIIGIPPLNEQKRIVEAIEKFEPLLAEYEKLEQQATKLDNEIFDKLKKSVLQYAIQGKLVPQDNSDKPASVLLAKIKAEKESLIKQGKIKKEKPQPPIADDEKTFDIPDNWEWVRLGEISSYNQKKDKIEPKDIVGDMWSLDLEDIEKESGKIIKICKASERKISGDKICFNKGQILYSKLRPYLKKILIAPANGICSAEMVPFSLYGQTNSSYVINFLKSPHVDFMINSVTYGVKMPRVGTETMINLVLPLPPLNEQKRIVARIEEIFAQIEKIHNS